MYEKIREKSTGEIKEKKPLLVSVYKGDESVEVCKEHLDELEFLCETYHLEPQEKVVCHVRRYDASTFITSGKLEELVAIVKEKALNLVVFDDELSPSQQRNLEKVFAVPVIDRTEVILGIFAERARTKEARLQVELAETKYQAPRLKKMWAHLGRQTATSGGGGYLKGKGETQIEIDRRLLKNKISQLQKEIDEIRDVRTTQRGLREKTGIPVFAIIGYTNAGKSTLLNALTDAGIFVEDKLFATLDTTTRKFILPTNEEILLIDTVGFIRKLPHLLVAAFRSTLEEATQADFLLHLVDVSHPMAEEQAEASCEVLKELGAEKKPIITVLNKEDKIENKAMLFRMQHKYPKTVTISALNKTGFEGMLKAMMEELKKRRQTVLLRVPQKDYHIVSQVISEGHLLTQEYEENDILMKVELPSSFVSKVKRYIESVSENLGG